MSWVKTNNFSGGSWRHEINIECYFVTFIKFWIF